MKEIDVSFENKGENVSGVLHIPKEETDKAVIIAHGFTGYKREVQIVNCARSLAKEGFATLRFDFRGSGSSDGLFRDMTISGEVSDLEKAIEFMKKKGYNKIGLIGHSLGGLVVILVNKKYISTIVLWAPSISIKKLITMLLGRKIKTIEKQGYAPISWDGKAIEFIVGKTFWEEVKNKFPDVTEHLLSLKIPKTVIYGSKDMENNLKTGVDMRKLLYPSNNLKIIKNADHTFSKYEYEKPLIDYTIKWFKKWLK
ncbi:MAG: alpha/beta fold hydrolase [Candidatus Aenigmarchaeota archaeon]|nr:alpha/beta fold hydrolase [Candidatus Aenigmarchaeota archaeon]